MLSLLKQKGLANELSAGLSNSQSAFSSFAVSVDCTDAGIAAVDEVVQTVYEYLAMLRAAGPQEWIFRESQDISNMNFRFKSKVSESGRGGPPAPSTCMPMHVAS